jgi:rhodanese-related sulfurtransferase
MVTTKLNKPVEDLYSKDFQQKIAETADAVILDVRTEEEFRSGRISDAININVMGGSFIDKVDSLDKSKTYFVYCRSGGRSGQACALMAGRGFNVYNLAGGIMNWSGNII